MKNESDIKNEINGSIKITNHHVALAKGFLLNCTDTSIDTKSTMGEFVKQQGYTKPAQIIIHETVPLEPQIGKVIGFFIFSIAFCEAVNALVNGGYFLPKGQWGNIIDYNLGWTTVVPGSGGQSSGWNFDEFCFDVPLHMLRAFSKRKNDSAFNDPDVFILEIGIHNAHRDVTEALKDTIRCFKNDLFHPSITMLSKALEGAWIELGISLANMVADKKTDVDKFIDKLKGSDSFVWKVQEVVKLYEKQDWFKPLKVASGIDLNMLREVQNWSDIVRDSRNAIHFGVESSTPNTYEKASVLLLGAVKYLRALYKLKEHADVIKRA